MSKIITKTIYIAFIMALCAGSAFAQAGDNQLVLTRGDECNPPTNFNVIYTTDCDALLTWDAPEGNDFATYYVYRDGILLASMNAQSYVDFGLNPYTYHVWEVTTICPGGGESEPVTKILAGCNGDCEPPTNFNVIYTVDNYTLLTWEAPIDDPFATYNIYRDGVFIEAQWPVTLYYDQTFDPFSSHEWCVKVACIATGESASVCGELPACGYCDLPYNFEVTYTSNCDALLTWETFPSSDPVSFNIYRDACLIASQISDLSFIDMGASLNPFIEHTWTVRAKCPDGSESVPVSKTMPPCTPCQDITIGNGTTAVNYLPLSTNYRYSYSQQIITADQLGVAPITEITSISFNYILPTPRMMNSKIFLAHTLKSAFLSSTGWLPLTEFTLVFDGIITYNNSNQWVTIYFNTPFIYAGGNLVIAYLNDGGGYSTNSDPSFLVQDVPENRSIYWRSDTAPINPTSPPTASGIVKFINNIQLGICSSEPAITCNYPSNLKLESCTETTASFTWISEASINEWEIELVGPGQYLGSGTLYTVSTPSYDFIDLTPNTTYWVYVRAKCGDGNYSSWISAFFKTSYYTITATAGTGGTINPSGQIVASYGSNQTFTFIPDPCYVIDQVLIDGYPNATAKANGFYTFKNIFSNHTVEVSFTETTTIQWQIGALNDADVTATLNTCNGTFTISGNGAMKDYNIPTNNPPWYPTYRNSFTTVIIEDGVTNIGNYAFVYCSNVTAATIGNSVTDIGMDAFRGCGSMTSINFGNNVKNIWQGAFYSCESLISVQLPDNLEFIGFGAFAACADLTSIYIPNSVNTIGGNAFGSCSSLPTIDIPYSVLTIGSDAFTWCSNLTSINVDANNPFYSSNNGILYSKMKEILHCYPAGKTGDFTIPNSVQAIGSYAFTSCSHLTAITIPNSVTSIGFQAFNSCSSLTSVTIPNRVISLGYFAFVSCSNLQTVTIPNNIADIGEAFQGCIGLTDVFVEWTIPIQVSPIAFLNVQTTNVNLYVPCGTEMLYSAEPVWQDFNIICTGKSHYSITVTHGTGGVVSPNGLIKVPAGEDKTCIIIPKSGYKINKVWVDGVENPQVTTDGFYTFTNMSDDHTLSATFTYISQNQFFINSSVTTTGGTISPSGKISVLTGDEPTFVITAQTTYQIKELLINGINYLPAVGLLSYAYTFEPIESSHTIVVKFEKQTFTITASVTTAGGTIAPIGASVITYGGSKAYTTTPQAGYLIDEVLINGVNNPTAATSGKYTFSNVNDNHTIVASFKQRTYAITATAGAGGLINPNGIATVLHGNSLTYFITPDVGYMIKQVLVNGKNVAASVVSGTYTFTTVTANQTISATFVPVNSTSGVASEYEISIFPNPTTGELKIESGELKVENIQLYDMLGKKVLEQKAEDVTLHQIDLSQLPAGVYFVKITTDNGVITKKIVKE